MAHHRRQIRGVCVRRRAVKHLQPCSAHQTLPTQKVDLMKTVYPEEDYCRKSLTLSIVPEVDEEEEERAVETLSATFPHPEESPKNLKRKASLVDLVLEVAFLMRRKVKRKN